MSPTSGIAAGVCSMSPTPAAPEYCSFIPGPENTWTIQVQVAEGKMIAGLERIAPGWGGADGQPFTEGFFIFDVSAPTEPKKIGHFQTGSTGTHRNFYDGGNLVHAAAGAPESDRKNLPHRRYRRSGQPTRSRPLSHCRSRRKAPTTNGLKFSCHGPAHIEGDRAYLSYGDGGGIILDVERLSPAKND